MLHRWRLIYNDGYKTYMTFFTKELATHPLDRTDMTKYVGRVRCFSPLELLLLFGFPAKFSFPPNLQRKHCFKLIGNSVNVHVISEMLKIVFSAPGHSTSTAHRYDKKKEERERKEKQAHECADQWRWVAAVGLLVGLNIGLRRCVSWEVVFESRDDDKWNFSKTST